MQVSPNYEEQQASERNLYEQLSLSHRAIIFTHQSEHGRSQTAYPACPSTNRKLRFAMTFGDTSMKTKPTADASGARLAPVRRTRATTTHSLTARSPDLRLTNAPRFHLRSSVLESKTLLLRTSITCSFIIILGRMVLRRSVREYHGIVCLLISRRLLLQCQLSASP
jgi:hypothetical protein